MPLILAAALAWIAGVAGGFGSASPLAAALAASIALVALVLQRATVPAALCLLVAAGHETGRSAHAADLACLARARAAGPWLAELHDAAEAGAFVRAELVAAGGVAQRVGATWPRCRVRIAVAVRSGRAPVGAVVRVSRAEPSEGDRGLLLRDAHVTPVHGPGPLERWRARVAERLDRLFGPDAPMVRALLIADARGLAPDLRDRYADAGLVHLLSISGLHVAIVGGALLLALGAARIGPRTAAPLAVAIVALYVLAIGAPPPAVRSATLFAATQLTRLAQRPVSPWGSFALGAVVPLGDPRTVLDLGWQLSVSGYAAILVAGRVGRRLPEGLDGWRRTLARELIAGTLSTLATAPLVAWHFGRLSLVAPVSNLAAGPIIALLQPALFVAMLVPEALGAAFVVDAARPLLRAMDAVAAVAARLPGAAVVVAPTLPAALLAAFATVALLVAGWSRAWARPLMLALGAAALLAWVPDPRAPRLGAGGVELHLIDVGQGDAIALRSPRGRWVLVDAGRSWSRGDAGRATVIPYLRRRGGPLALLILTHPHADHIGGAASVVRALRPGELRDAAFVAGSEDYRRLLRTAAESGTRWQRVRPGEVLDVDGLELEFLAPDSAWTAGLGDPNEASTVVRARYGEVRFLLTGDAEAAEEAWLLSNQRDRLAADVLKAAHHGSSTSSGAAFVDAVAPRLALVSVGRENRYGHPSAAVLERLAARGTLVLRTDQLGSVVLRTDGRRIEAEAAGARWAVARPLPVPR